MDYERIYNRLITKCRDRKTVSGLTHNHHVIPLWLKGSDIKDNLVVLTLREHFVAHVLLAKWIGSKEAWAAVKIMGEGFSFRHSRFYERAVLDFQINNPNKEPHNRNKIAERMRISNPMKVPAVVAKMSASQKARYADNPELRLEVSGDNSPTRRPEVRAKMAESARVRFSRQEERNKASERTKAYNRRLKEETV